jgi:23S rRNA (adenine2503-C2)-methyltransferase
MRHLADVRHRLHALGAKPAHVRMLLRSWVRSQPLAEVARNPLPSLPRTLRDRLPEVAAELRGIAGLRSRHAAGDGSSRLLVGLSDGETIESVLLPRNGACVSTQVGCAVGCAFCMTGRDGLRRQLGSAEIVAQVALARTLAPVTKVVFMGMGEPAHNLDAVLEAIDLLATEGAIAHKNLVVSTVGDLRVFDRLPRQRVKPALALSLHSMNAARRASLLPRAPRIDPVELVELGERYARSTHYPIQYQWTLLDGVNDGDDEVDAIARALGGKYAVMNLIPYNDVDGAPFRRPPVERMTTIARRLHQAGVLTKLRQSAGQDVDAGCGQLRSRSEPSIRVSLTERIPG